MTIATDTSAKSVDHPRRGVGIAQQIPRNSLALLMIAQVAVVLPLAAYISFWIVGVCLTCGYWRMQVYRGRWDFPPGWVKTLLVLGSIVGIALSGYRTFSLEAATSLLVLAFALKLIEMRNRRDAYLMIYLSYFLIANGFLFDQSMTMTAYELFAAILVTAAMVGMNQLQTRVRLLASVWTAAGLILQAVPLMLVMFLLFPRLPPLWSIPMPSAATTGLSDRLTPGDVATLSQSDEVAFRAVFEGEVPLQRELYWRGLVYSNFYRGTWSIAEPLEEIDLGVLDEQGLAYEIFLEPTQSNWAYSLDTPVQYNRRLSLLGDYRLESNEPVLSVMRYRVVSQTDFVMDPELSDAVYLRETRFDRRDNQELQAYAADLYERAGSALNMITVMQNHIREQPFVYTLNPPTLGRQNSIDEFWFEHRRGFCTHYAGAMVFALRSVGIPARMVGGYQGGEVNPVTGHVVVRQYQAHAWVEAWIEGNGWQRFDPTAAVAPARVEQGLNAALSDADRATLSLFSAARFDERDVVTRFIQFFDSLEHRWNLWVVGYDAASQADVLRQLLGKVTPARIGMALVLGGGLSVAAVVIALFWRRRPLQRHPTERLFSRFCAAAARSGHPRLPHETPVAFVRRVAALADVDASTLCRQLEAHLYDPAVEPTRAQRFEIRQALQKLRFRLAFVASRVAS